MILFKKHLFLISIMIVSLSLLSCTNSRIEKAERFEEEDMILINLRGFDETLRKQNIDVFLERIPAYLNDCKISEFTLKKQYADFIQTETKIFDEDDYKKISAYYRKENNSKEDDYDANISIWFYESREDSHRSMRDLLNDNTAPIVNQSAFKVGDFAIGDIFTIDFIRGNVNIRIKGYDVEIDKLAREIDQQILEIINDKN